jgi:putative pyruvate formate lyase activating enzyme
VSERKIARIDRALDALERLESDCTLCPRACHVDRRKEAAGICRSGARATVSSALLHFGEEPVLSGLKDCADPGASSRAGRGSGTIFFSGCNLGCLFCQNYQISWLGQGRTVEDAELAEIMLDLERQGALNINLVSPTHLILPILRSLRIAYARGLSLPLVYNSNGYEAVEVIERLAGIVDVYLPDCKYALSEPARRYSGAADYFDRAKPAIQEMFLQKPDFLIDEQGIAEAGLIVRHLVLPGQMANSLAVLEWLATTFSTSVPLSLMSQYRPCWRAPEEISRPLTLDEYRLILNRAHQWGFETLFAQPDLFESEDHLNPDFDKKEPFRWTPANK